MPIQVSVEQNQLRHTGFFTRPLLGLWGDGKTLLQGLYGAFSPYGATIANIRNESTSLSPNDQVVSVSLGLNKIHRFRLDRTETTVTNFSQEDLKAFPELIAASERWMREAVPSFAFGSHVFAYAAHGRPRGESVEEMLKALGPSAPSVGGTDRGTGLTFHWELPDSGWRTQLAIDHSILIPEGLFIMFTLRVDADSLDYGKLAEEGRKYLDGVMNEVGLSISRSA